MRYIESHEITEAVARLCQEANFDLGADVISSYQTALAAEESEIGKEVFRQILENADIARNEKVPSCQDTGVAVLFLDLGQDLHITGGDLRDAVEAGVRMGYLDGFLRKSMCDPFTRKNTSTNLPAIIHVDIVPGDHLRITLAPKGGGSENMSTVCMMKPSDGREGVIRQVVEWVKKAGSNPCPPIVVGVGIGGNFEKSAILAKKALLRPLGQRNTLPDIAQLELDILKQVNDLGIGPMGLGGRFTALDVHVEYMPCHIASLPVGINIQCHACRHKETVL